MATKAKQVFGPVRSGAVVGVVLAGGEGRRMGPGLLKPLRRLGGRPMVAHVVERLRPQVMDLVVVANDPLPGTRALKVPIVADPPDVLEVARRDGKRLGPLAGILAGMEWARAHHPHAGWILTVPADVPFLPLDLTVRLCGLMHVPEPDVLMVRHGRRREHTLAIWSVRLAADLRRALIEEGVRRVEAFADRHRLAELAWTDGAAAFLNVNTPETLRAAERQLARAAGRGRGPGNKFS
ncbi:MAG: molybdenum cofactor guanylyltransferase [Reyranellaceae bacterium]